MAKRNLNNFDTEVFVTSSIYFPKDDLEQFATLFSSLEIIDDRLDAYVNAIKALLKNKSFDNLPKNPEERKQKIINLVTKQLETIPQSILREKVINWFTTACKKEQDIELYDELLDRYCWEEFMDRVNRENTNKNSFKDKLNIKPIIPDISDEEIQPFGEVEEEEEATQEVFPTGIILLDKILFMRRTNFVVVAARTSVGKSLFMINQAIHNAKRGIPCMYVSLEESASEIKKRILIHIRDAKQNEVNSINQNLYLYSAKISSPDSIFNKIDKIIEKQGIKIVFFDYLQLMKYPGMSDFDSLRELTRELKLYATSRNVLVVTASQLKRETEMMGTSLTGLFGSSTIEADANAIVLMEPMKKQQVRIENKAPIILNVAKNRSGEVKEIENVMIDYSNGHIGIQR